MLKQKPAILPFPAIRKWLLEIITATSNSSLISTVHEIRKDQDVKDSVLENRKKINSSGIIISITWISGSVGATFISTSLVASNIPVRKPWLKCQ